MQRLQDTPPFRAGRFIGTHAAEFVSMLDGIGGLPAVQYTQYGTPEVGSKEISNLDAILSALETRLTSLINSAMNVDGIANGSDKAKIMELNGYLLTQIGEDIPQFQAKLDDCNEFTLNEAYFTWNYYYAMAQGG